MWVTAATFSIRKTRYCRNAEYRKIMQEKVRAEDRSGDRVALSPSAAHKKYACFRRRIFCA